MADQTSIFIGYRRDDTADVVGRIYDRLCSKFGESQVFKDVDKMPVGRDFGAHVLSILPRCRVFLAMIGPHWVEARTPDGQRRLDDPGDWVRIELETALSTPGVHVVPVLVNGAVIPGKEQLPPSLHGLSALNAAIVRRDPDFHKDMDRLISALDIGPAAPGKTTLTPKSLLVIGGGIIVAALAVNAMKPKPALSGFPSGVVAGPQVDPAAKRVVGDAAWPPKDIKAMARRATDYVHKKWRNDAVLMSIRLTANQNTGNTDAIFSYYSADQEQMVSFMSAIQGITSPSARDEDVSHAIGANFMDLNDAIDAAHAQGLHGKQIEEATLEWSSGEPCGTGNFAIDNAILPVCGPGPRFEGLQWQVDSALGDRKWVPATN